MQVATSFLFWMNTIAPFDLEVTSTQGILWNSSHEIKDMIKEVMAKEEENRYKPPVEGCEDLSMTEEERKKLLEAFSFLWDKKQ